MGFTRFVEIGRVALINYGPEAGKLCTVIDIIDNNRVLVDGPREVTGVHRQVVTCKRLSLTDLVVKIPRNAKEKKILAAWESQGILEAWNATPWAKKLAVKAKRANLSDFDRFKVMVAKKQRAQIVGDKLRSISA
mmetsp:Transcript_19646/g.14102  ORF Transcript_19646/g.14102 Transcript_19646/m.14102 type:complete len:135 (+) Transcript_19646:20-424(+)|eukprot:CAMPEP_0116942278 /NCGR_PEP_ID=MMETSP0467-20121206/34504_1 /TAXON_ID=283647 /ORGANISM="Mesodinium pulex, Strain SPMC105" /LENGTH=134 /DNA_ID=CAMNT_0004625253 /DNA_START=32 /DNA_END=436 /DNA_ORIENTATION=-